MVGDGVSRFGEVRQFRCGVASDVKSWSGKAGGQRCAWSGSDRVGSDEVWLGSNGKARCARVGFGSAVVERFVMRWKVQVGRVLVWRLWHGLGREGWEDFGTPGQSWNGRSGIGGSWSDMACGGSYGTVGEGSASRGRLWLGSFGEARSVRPRSGQSRLGLAAMRWRATTCNGRAGLGSRVLVRVGQQGQARVRQSWLGPSRLGKPRPA